MPYRNKTYICFDGDNDMHYYRLMTAWKVQDGSSFNFHNAHDLNSARDTSQEESIKRQLRERFANSKLFIVLIGEKTRYLRKFVEWEIETAVKLDLPIIAVNINKSKTQDSYCPPSLRNQLAVYVPYFRSIIEHAMSEWPADHLRYRKDKKSGPYFFSEHVYQKLGIA